MDICHAAGPISPIVSVALQGFCIEILYMPSNTDLSPLSDLQAWPLSKAYPCLWWWQKGSVTKPLSLSSGWKNVVVGEKAWKCQSQTMNGTDAGFMAPKCDRWRTTLPALTHGTLPVMLVCSKNILIVLLIRILQADLKLLEIYLLMGLSDSYSKKKNTKKKVPLISTSTSQARACISVLVHQQTSDLQWMRVSRRQCVQGNGNTNALTPRVSVLISALSNSRLPHMSFTQTCQKAGSTRRGLSFCTSTPLLVFSQCSFCKPFLLKEALQKVGLSRSMGSVHQRPSMSLCCVRSQWRSWAKGAQCSQTRVACCGEEEKWMAKWGLIELWEAES